MSFSIVILTYNEECNLSSCLDSVAWCDDVVVLDSGSSDATAEIARGRGIEVESLVREGYPATVIEEEAHRVHADLIVIGSQGRSKLKHLLVGSIAERVVHKAHCPVLTVKPTTH